MEGMQCLGGNGYINGESTPWSIDYLKAVTNPALSTPRLPGGSTAAGRSVVHGWGWHAGNSTYAHRTRVQRGVQALSTGVLKAFVRQLYGIY